MERAPAAVTRSASQSGEGPTLTPSMTRAVYRWQRSGSAISSRTESATSLPAVSAASLSMSSCRGQDTADWYIAPTSRARPVTDRQSGRLGVISRSSTVSPSPRYSEKGAPVGASSGSTQMPSWSVPCPSSRREQHMPQLTTPRSLLFLILKSPGSTAPTHATGTLMPAAMLGAPQTTCTGSSAPTSTETTCIWSESGWSSQVSTWPTTTPSSASPSFSTPSTPVPVRSSRSGTLT